MYFLPISLAIFVVFLLLVPFLFFIIPSVAFAKLGFNPLSGLAFFFFCLAGSMINIPVHRSKLPYYYEEPDDITRVFNRFLGIRVPVFKEQIISINLGGAVLPGLLCLYLLPDVNKDALIPALLITIACSYFLSKPVRGVGIVIPAFIPPVIAAVAALLLSEKGEAPPVAYISGVLGTLIGADMLRLNQVRSLGVSFLSIGGAGVFDGIFIVGIISVLLA